MINDHERSFTRWVNAKLITDLKICESNIRAYKEIMDLSDSGVISDIEFIDIVRRLT